MSNWVDSLNPEQLKAIKTTEGPVLILAGAGSGKTKTLTSRVAYLIQNKLATPGEILAVTFTNKAAGEMKQRIIDILKLKSDKAFYISTFHSLCSRILRAEIQHLGRNQSFTILDTDEQLTAVKQAMNETNIDIQKFAPAAVLNYISSAKGELIGADNYGEMSYGHFQKIVAKVYPRYQEIIRANNSVDFDDLLMLTVQLFQQHPTILTKYQGKFKYIMVDEYQDTNTAQYQLIKLLADKHKNIFVVGDDWQCLPPTTKILTNKGLYPIQKISRKNKIISASGRSEYSLFDIETIGKRKYQGPVLTIKTKNGHQITATPNHIFFARLPETLDKHFVYLMYSNHKGYRIGIAKGVRNSGKKLTCGLRVRCNQERADKMWILKICDSRQEAKYFEDYFSFNYGIPMTVFWNIPGRSMLYQQKYIDRLYRDINTQQHADVLMEDLMIDKEFPHFVPSATTPKNGQPRKILNLSMFGDMKRTLQSPWCATRLSLRSSDNELAKRLNKLGFNTRKGKKDSWRFESSNLDSQKFDDIARQLHMTVPEAIINRTAFITNNKFQFQPASNLRPNMIVPILSKDKIIEDTIKSVEQKNYKGNVFDLNIAKVHNFIANGFIVHNSIYSWRGANYRNILNFHKDYPKAQIIKLEENYRSTQNLLNGAAAVISTNKHRSDKNLWTKNSLGEKITVQQVFDQQQEGSFIIREVLRQKSIDPELNFNDFVVLYRTNAQSRALEEAFLQQGMPYRIIGGTRFYDRKEIRDVLAYMKLIANPQDDISMKRVINVPPRGVGEKTWEELQKQASANNQSIGDVLESVSIGQKAQVELKKLGVVISSARKDNRNLSKLFDFILEKTGYLTWLNDKTIEGETRIENVKELKSVIEKYDFLDIKIALPTFLEEVSLIQDIDRYSASENAVNLMTIHSAKGLEFKYVFMAGMEENLFPHSRSTLDNEELEEERRLCYVGITRAKQKLYLIYTTRRMLYGTVVPSLPSRFIDDIPEDLKTDEKASLITSGLSNIGKSMLNKVETKPSLQVKLGDLVEHKHFGNGKVISMDKSEVVISFQQFGIKRLARNLAPIKKIIIPS